MLTTKFISGITIAIILFSLSSCYKSKTIVDSLNTNNTQISSDVELLKIYNFTNTIVDGSFAYNSTGNFSSQSFARINSFSGTFHSSAAMGNFGTVQKGNLVKIGEEIIIPNSNNIYEKNYSTTDKVWGNSKEMSFQATTLANIAKTSFRIPQLIEIENYNSLLIGQQKLTMNGTINVKADNGNTKGIIVTIEYQPAYNDSLRLAGFTLPFINAEVQNDDGTIELSKTLFNNIPLNASYKLTIGRVNFKTIEAADGKKYGLYSYVNLSNFYTNN